MLPTIWSGLTRAVHHCGAAYQRRMAQFVEPGVQSLAEGSGRISLPVASLSRHDNLVVS